MSVPTTLRCLVRPSVPRHVPRQVAVVWAAPFSTTASLAANPPKKKASAQMASIRSGKKMQLGKFKKKAPGGRTGKSPLPGERKAVRKRIQLSNSNALPVPGLAELTSEYMADKVNAGTVVSLPGTVQDELRVIEAFKPTQYWGMFRNPSMLVRSETVDLIGRMQDSAEKKQTLKLVVSGDRLTGKSMLLLQGMAHGLLNEWIVINIPEAQELTTASTEYAPIPGTDPVQYMQNNYALKLVQAVRKANEKTLTRLTTAYSHPELPQNIPINSTLMQLANSAKEADSAWYVFHALWQELMAKGQGRPPILLTLDGLQHIMKVSDYRSAAYNPIHSHDLALVRLFTDCLAGNHQFPGGGAVLAATSRGNAPRVPSMELALSQRAAEQAGAEIPKHDPFFRDYDTRVEASLKKVQVLKVSGVSKLEARAVMEYWAASGVLRKTVDEATVTEKWTLGGHGVLGEMERASLLTMRP
ncbi:mitochondrial ribosomal protein [Lasiosphaeris hirsuta]|uniref:Small ribosomal subunit protein mS29 n=1 Tax=Lasiosphaeris hirsuta TaxID=260670 RepID=A0AA40BCT2_9PEZI|nr:mitochondrial ribosomal protein [Lasiosphaeris hirsuta]